MNTVRPLRHLLVLRNPYRNSTKRAFSSSIIRSNTQKPQTIINMATTDPSLPDKVPTVPTPAEPTLPKLNQHDFRIYNRMAEHMDYFHNHFRETWNVLYTACETGKRGKGMSIRQFIGLGQQFCSQLEMHHGIEERYVKSICSSDSSILTRSHRHIFPVLAKKMPAFKKELELLTQHKQIHKGLDKLTKYLEECSTGERELRLPELKRILDGFGTVLWQHLDDEVKELGAENMRKYWSKEEVMRMPM